MEVWKTVPSRHTRWGSLWWESEHCQKCHERNFGIDMVAFYFLCSRYLCALIWCLTLRLFILSPSDVCSKPSYTDCLLKLWRGVISVSAMPLILQGIELTSFSKESDGTSGILISCCADFAELNIRNFSGFPLLLQFPLHIAVHAQSSRPGLFLYWALAYSFNLLLIWIFCFKRPRLSPRHWIASVILLLLL